MKSKRKQAYFSYYLVLLIAILFSCNNKKFNDFKFKNQTVVLNCENKELNPLLNEALYSFENDIRNYYCEHKQQTLDYAYANFVYYSVNNKINYTEIVSPHTVKIFEALKEYDIWDTNNKVSKLDYNSKFFKCIALNIKEPNLNTTINALIITNSMSPKLFGTPLISQYRIIVTDKYLAAYVAFDLFYAKLFDLDLSQVKEKPTRKF